MQELNLFWLENGALKIISEHISHIDHFTDRLLKRVLINQLKNRMYRWMDSNKTENYIDSLGSILEGYNNATHSSIGLPPNVAWMDKSTHPQIREKLQVYYNKFPKIKPRLIIGDIVRIKLLTKSSF